MLAKLFYLICDRCGNPSSEGEDSATEARTRAMRAGWKRVQGRDLCPKCARDRHDHAPAPTVHEGGTDAGNG